MGFWGFGVLGGGGGAPACHGLAPLASCEEGMAGGPGHHRQGKTTGRAKHEGTARPNGRARPMAGQEQQVLLFAIKEGC